MDGLSAVSPRPRASADTSQIGDFAGRMPSSFFFEADIPMVPSSLDKDPSAPEKRSRATDALFSSALNCKRINGKVWRESSANPCPVGKLETTNRELGSLLTSCGQFLLFSKCSFGHVPPLLRNPWWAQPLAYKLQGYSAFSLETRGQGILPCLGGHPRPA